MEPTGLPPIRGRFPSRGLGSIKARYLSHRPRTQGSGRLWGDTTSVGGLAVYHQLGERWPTPRHLHLFLNRILAPTEVPWCREHQGPGFVYLPLMGQVRRGAGAFHPQSFLANVGL